MDQPKPCYDVCVPVSGTPDQFVAHFRALTPEGAAELVRVLLALGDPNVQSVHVGIGVALVPER